MNILKCKIIDQDNPMNFQNELTKSIDLNILHFSSKCRSIIIPDKIDNRHNIMLHDIIGQVCVDDDDIITDIKINEESKAFFVKEAYVMEKLELSKFIGYKLEF